MTTRHLAPGACASSIGSLAVSRFAAGLAVSACLATALAGCGGSSTRASGSDEGASATAGGTSASEVQVIAAGSPVPTLSEAMIQSDAADPALMVDRSSAWVVIPSFRLAFEMPAGWFWTNSEELIAQTATTRHTLDDESQASLRRSLQAAANQYSQGDPAHAGQLVPSVRILLLPGGLPRGATLQPDFCATEVLSQVQQMYPDAVSVGEARAVIGGRPSARCAFDHMVDTVALGNLPGHSEAAFVFGESHFVMVSAVGGVNDSQAQVLDAVLASARTL